MRRDEVQKAADLLQLANEAGIWQHCVAMADTIVVTVPGTGDLVGEDRAMAISAESGAAFRELKDHLMRLAAEKMADAEIKLRRLGVKGEL